MKASNKGWDQCGNAQAVANEDQIILAADVTDQANDKRQAVPMVDQALANLEAAGVEQAIGAAVIDSGYYSEANTTALEQRGIDPYMATERLKHQRGDPAGAARSDSRGPVGEAADGAEAEDEEGSRDVCEAKGDHRADLRPVETGAGLPPVLDARPGVDARRVAADVHGPQPAEAVAARSEWRWRGDPPAIVRKSVGATAMRSSPGDPGGLWSPKGRHPKNSCDGEDRRRPSRALFGRTPRLSTLSTLGCRSLSLGADHYDRHGPRRDLPHITTPAPALSPPGAAIERSSLFGSHLRTDKAGQGHVLLR